MTKKPGFGKFTDWFFYNKRLLVKRFLHILFLFANIGWSAAARGQVYVSVDGNDLNEGSIQQPKASVHGAIRTVREFRRLNHPATRGPIHIIVQEGIYPLSEPVVIRPEDAGTPQSPTYIEAAPKAQVVLSGGIPIKGWQPLKDATLQLPAGIWVAPLPDDLIGLPAFRQLWINGQKATRARWPNEGRMERILSWNKKDETALIPPPPVRIENPQAMELFIHQWWEIAILRIKQMQWLADSVRLVFRQPESRIQSEHPWPAPWISKETGNSAFFLSNTIELLDAPGEWYADFAGKKIYYWPHAQEDLRTARVIAPMLENLVSIEGTVDHPVSQVHFKNIGFEHVGWYRPALQGHVPHQAGMPMTDAYKLRPSGTPDKASLENQAWITRPQAAVKARFAQEISFEACRFEHLAATGLDYDKGVKNARITGNLFKDIGGTAILAGVFSDAAQEIHLPYHPKDERVVTEGLMIANNFITNATNEDWGAVGIGLGYTRHSQVLHNEVENVNYSGISAGWGWSPKPNVMQQNTIRANSIHHYGKQNYDCAGIYTLSAQPGTLISENYIDSVYKAPYAHLPSHWFYLYTDEGSSHITIKDNWTPSQKYLQNNNGPGNQWINNGPQVAASIKARAGLEAPYRQLATESTHRQVAQSINTEHEELVELVVQKGKLDIKRLRAFLRQQQVDPDRIYQWKNHYVIFDKVQDLSVFQGKLKKAFPEVEVRPYYDMYYQFDRSRCADTVTATQWKHIILTANLVADEKMQQSYLEHHATQFEKWPEVAKGFCNADFQRLVMFRNGRQLMLVISIPEGTSLDALNPRTTQNNPRVAEWNTLMAQYQEGIADAPKNTVWVLLDPIKPTIK